MDDLSEQIEGVAEHEDLKSSIIERFQKEALPKCRGYVLIWIDEEDVPWHVRWNLRPWQVRGAFQEVEARLDSIDVAMEIHGEEE